MSKSKLLFAALICLPIMACAATPNSVETRLPNVATPNAEPVVMQGYTWTVYKNADIQKLADDLKANPSKKVTIYALTPNGYQHLHGDYLELERYIKEQQAIIVYLKNEISDRAPTTTIPSK